MSDPQFCILATCVAVLIPVGVLAIFALLWAMQNAPGSEDDQ